MCASYPVATKRVLRAILKAADLCASDPQWVAQQLVDRGFVPQYDYALQTLNEIRYDRWRDFDAGGHRCGSTRCGCTKRA